MGFKVQKQKLSNYFSLSHTETTQKSASLLKFFHNNNIKKNKTIGDVHAENKLLCDERHSDATTSHTTRIVAAENEQLSSLLFIIFASLLGDSICQQLSFFLKRKTDLWVGDLV